MNKILFISHGLESSGWGVAARGYINAMDTAGLDVVPRFVTLGSANHKLSPRLQELSEKDSKGCNICIQHVLPHLLDYNGRFDRNIALAVYENLGAGMSNWQTKIDCFDELWTASRYAAECFRSMSVTIPIEVVPHAFDMSVYSKSYEPISHPELDGNFIFYTIADLNRRKDIGSLIKSFHLAFTPNEGVKLLIKTSKHGLTPNQCAESLSRDCKAIKEGMKLYRRAEDYIDEVIIPEFLEEEELMRVHSTGHCFVSTSHGEAWNQPLFDAASMGKFCIHTQQDSEIPHYDYAAGIPVPCHDTISFGSEGFFELGSSREIYSQVEPHVLAGIMRNVYENRDNTKYSKMCENNARANQRYSFENVGNHIKTLLEKN